MKTIYHDGQYEVRVDVERGLAELQNGAQVAKLALIEAKPLPSPVSVMLKSKGQDPSKFVFVTPNVLRRAALEAWDQALQDYRRHLVDKATSKESQIEGLEELRAAQGAEHTYQKKFRHMMEQEDVRAPSKPLLSFPELAKKYPRAEVYLRAEAFEDATNDQRSAAGTEAKLCILNGGSAQKAEEILDSWSKR
jgi:hypothetical protein